MSCNDVWHRRVRIIKRQQLNYMNAYNAVCEVEGLGTWNVLVSYCTPVLATDGDALIALRDATCSRTTARHVGVWLRRFAPAYSYYDVKRALAAHGYSTTDVSSDKPSTTAQHEWIYDLLRMEPCKRFCNGIYYIERGEGPWSRLRY